MAQFSQVDIILLVALLVAIVLLVVITYVLLKLQAASRRRIEQLLKDHDRDVAEARKHSVEQSRSSLKGHIAEQMAPLLPGFVYAPSDAHFIGDPIDYLVFNNYTRLRDGEGEPPELEVVLLEIKQGKSALNPFQRAIARAIEAGRIRFEVCRVGDDSSVTTSTWRLPGRQGNAPLIE